MTAESTPASSLPERFDYFQGHGLGWYGLFTWENDKRLLLKRTSRYKDKNGYHEEVEQFDPSPQG